MGMLVAYLTSITLLPALLKVLNPPGEPEPLGFAFLAPVDRFMERHRIAIIVGVAIVSLGGLPLLYFLQFDFNPINLRNPQVESIATFLDLRRDPNTGASCDQRDGAVAARRGPVAERLSKLPGGLARHARSTSSCRRIRSASSPRSRSRATRSRRRSSPRRCSKPPTDEENVHRAERGGDGAERSRREARERAGRADAAKRLAGALDKLAKATPQMREQVEAAFVRPLKTALADLKDLLQAHTSHARRRCRARSSSTGVTADGRARVEVLPKGDPNDNETLRKFARAVLAVEPDATGGPISILESGHTIVRAFFEAGAWALIAIAILLWIVLRVSATCC